MAMGKHGCVLTATVTLIIVLNLCTDSTLANADNAWKQWKVKHEKTYSCQLEEDFRRAIWEKNVHRINEHNAKQTTFKLGMNHLGDQVIRWKILGRLDDTSVSGKNEEKKLPDNWDWRQHGVITPIKHQGAMGSVIAFTAAGCVESYHAIKTKKLLDLSVQQVQDCCPRFADKVFGCIHELGGMCLAADYKSGPLGSCNMASCTPVAQIQGSKKVIAKNETDLQVSVLITPVLTLIDASRPSFMFYKSGVYDDPACSGTTLNHAVQVVGYGSAGGKDYWICRNSWGASWGEKGYIRIARNHGNRCGIASMPYYPV